MKGNKKLCVIIPVHKPVLTDEEIISLQACYQHLKAYDCFLVFPEGMNTTSYTNIHTSLILKPVAGACLATVEAYNRMKTSVVFYEMFNKYDFMMTYESDAYIFNNAIEKYFGYGFDFIGAPLYDDKKNFSGGLNSGFSIRNIKTTITALQALKKYKLNWKWQRFIYWNIPFIKRFFNHNKKFLLKDGYLKAFYRSGYFHEDYIFTLIVPLIFSAFKVAPPEKALQFSFEKNPDLLYEMNNKQLPLGCHAWPKHIEFWKRYINEG